MMPIEKQLALSDLPSYMREKKIRDFAKNIVKYQKFKTNVALSKFDYSYKDSTAVSFFNWGVKYIKTKIKSGKQETLYRYIDDCIEQCVTPLVPSREDEREIKVYRTLDKEVNKSEDLTVTKKQESLSEEEKKEARDKFYNSTNLKPFSSVLTPVQVINDKLTAEEPEACSETCEATMFGLREGNSIRIMEEEEIDNFIKTTTMFTGKCNYKKVKVFFEEI